MRIGRDAMLLLARILLALGYLGSGPTNLEAWPRITLFSPAFPIPFSFVAGLIFLFCEIVITALVVLGIRVRPAAILMVLFTLGTSLFVHHYWNLTGSIAVATRSQFYNNLGLVGGFLLLAITGPGRFSLGSNR